MIRKFLIALLFALPVVAQEAAAPRFFIERIDVRNTKRVTPDVIVFESRLREGQEYSETDLSDAAARLQRLPFLLSADFSLERGSERGRHVLVITVSETRPFFYKLDLVPIVASDAGTARYVDEHIAVGSGTDVALGFRWFVGRRGALHMGLQISDDNRDYTEEYGAWAMGYTHYDIFGTRAFATVNLKYALGSGSNKGFGAISPQVVVGMPLTANQTLTLSYDESVIEGDTVRFGVPGGENIELEDDESQRLLTLKWAYDTTNHPFLPTRGTLLSVTPNAVWRDLVGYAYEFNPPGNLDFYTPVVWHGRSLGIDGSARRYWELSERHSVSAGLDAGWGKTKARAVALGEYNYDSRYAIARAGYSFSFWDQSRTARDGDSRLEVNLAGLARSRGSERIFREERDVFQISTNWVRRNSWGTLRLGVGYGW